ncbi:unnamed protein product [Meganyctiphanes norvegica]|uniref:Uncharacterized protein n=1 Tax=Meganyctiphanes norvegica TaxID=48144 RepID=A0AAV2PKV9_MEGNR
MDLVSENINLKNATKYTLKGSIIPKYNKHLPRSNSNVELNDLPSNLNTKSNYSTLSSSNHLIRSSLYAKSLLNSQRKCEDSKNIYNNSQSNIPKPRQVSKTNTNSKEKNLNSPSNDNSSKKSSNTLSRIKKPTKININL